MNMKRLNWPLWVGFLLTLAAFLTYFFVFIWFPSTRDFPWANLLLFLIAGVLLFMGVRRGFAADLPHPTRSVSLCLRCSSSRSLLPAVGFRPRKAHRRWANEHPISRCLILPESPYLSMSF